MKKIFFMLEVFLLSFLLMGCGTDSDYASDPECANKDIIDTTTGSFCGVNKNDLTIYKGIKYADASKINRWKRAADVPDSPAVKLANSYGNICYQADDQQYKSALMSEDCLYLNIWKPEDASPENLKKVMVYIHGGAFIRGSSSNPVYDGDNLANKNDVIVVNF
ncbi:MAG: carboxylesterase family protein, partial [Sulfurimonas sp.]|nr:carboxylesterase family protein [Sulfurimonas sp.]